MKRKIKEIVLLLVPVAALAVLVPGVRWFNNWRAVPRIEMCILRPATAWEASQGATVGYTARTVTPDAGGPFWSGGIEIRNARGESWASDAPGWGKIAVPSDDDYPDDGVASDDIGSADNRSGGTMELRGGLKWKRVAEKDASVQAEISLWPNVDDGAPYHVEKTRIFTLQNEVAPPRFKALRRSNFQLEKVQLTTSDCGQGCGLSHRLEFLLERSSSIPKPSLCVSSVGQGKLSFNANNQVLPIISALEDDWFKPGRMMSITMTYDENTPSLRDQPAHFIGLLSIDDGWPQEIRVELPQGLPTQIGTINLPFTAPLAPLPK